MMACTSFYHEQDRLYMIIYEHKYTYYYFIIILLRPHYLYIIQKEKKRECNKTSIEWDSMKKLPVSEPWLAFAGTFDVLLLCLRIYRKRRKYRVIEMV